MTWIRDHAAQKPTVTVLANIMGMTRPQLEQRFRRELDRTVQEEIQRACDSAALRSKRSSQKLSLVSAAHVPVPANSTAFVEPLRRVTLRFASREKYGFGIDERPPSPCVIYELNWRSNAGTSEIGERIDSRDATWIVSVRTRHTATGLVGAVSLAGWLALGCEADAGSKKPQSSGAAANGGASGSTEQRGFGWHGRRSERRQRIAASPHPSADERRVRRFGSGPAWYDRHPSVTLAFPPDTRQGPTNSPAGAAFTVNDAQRVDSVLADKLDAAAQALVSEARESGRLAALAPCAAPTSTGEQCAKDFLRTFGAKAYRRPLSDAEVDLLASGPASAYHVGADGYAYEDGVAQLLRVLLQQPAFLYTTELGAIGSTGTFELTQDEIATALAYLLTSSPPNEPLRQRVAAGDLTAAEAREAEAARLLASPAGKARLVRVVQEWLGIDQVARRRRRPASIPQLFDHCPAVGRREPRVHRRSLEPLDWHAD